MSDDTKVTIAIAVIGWIFSAGGLVVWARMSITALRDELRKSRADLYRDLNGVGNRVRQNQDEAAKRHQNISLAIVHAAPPGKEREICELMKENP